MTKKKELKILFVDDEVDNLDAFVFNCESFWDTHTQTSPKEVINGNYSLEGQDAVIADMVFGHPSTLDRNQQMDASTGLGFVEWLHKHHPKLPVIVLSAFLTADLRKEIRKRHPEAMLMEKPLDFSTAAFRGLMKKFVEDYRRKTR